MKIVWMLTLITLLFTHLPVSAEPNLSSQTIAWIAGQIIDDKINFETKARLMELVGSDAESRGALKAEVDRQLQGKSPTAFLQSLEQMPRHARISPVSFGIAGSIRTLFAIGFFFSMRGSLFSLASAANSVAAHQMLLNISALSFGFLFFLFLKNDISTFLHERPVSKDWKANLGALKLTLDQLRDLKTPMNKKGLERLKLKVKDPESFAVLDSELTKQIQRFIGSGTQTTRLSLLEASYALEDQYARDKLRPVQPSREFFIFNTVMVLALNWFSYQSSIGFDKMAYDSFLETFLKSHPDAYRYILSSGILGTWFYWLYRFPAFRQEMRRVIREVPDLSSAEWQYMRKLILETPPVPSNQVLTGPALPETATGLVSQLARMTDSSPAILNNHSTPKSFTDLCRIAFRKILGKNSH